MIHEQSDFSKIFIGELGRTTGMFLAWFKKSKLSGLKVQFPSRKLGSKRGGGPGRGRGCL